MVAMCSWQADVSEAVVDYGAVITQQRIVLRNIPVGTARCVFTADDFGAFLVHPLMKAAAAKAVQVSGCAWVWQDAPAGPEAVSDSHMTV